MADLRHRIVGAGGSSGNTPSASRDHSPAPEHQAREGGAYKIVPQHQIEKLRDEVKRVRRRGTKSSNAWMFALGGAFGILMAAFLLITYGNLEKVVEMAGMKDMNLDSFMDVLPAGIIRDVQDLQVS